jgi:hypothetical protein
MLVPFLVAFALAGKKKDVIIEMDNHRFRQSIFHRNQLDVWLSLFSSPSIAGHVEANAAFEEAFELGRGFLKFGYLDNLKCVKTPRRLGVREFPAFCVFHPNGHTCLPANITGRQLINKAGVFYPDYTTRAQPRWVDEINDPFVILFTEKPQPTYLWSAISRHFHKHPIRVGFSNDHAVADKLGISNFPAIVLRNQTVKIEYDGALSFVALRDTIKQFTQKKLQKIPTAIRVFGVKDFGEKCKGKDKICIIDSVSADAAALEPLRKQHRSASLEFFVGKDELPLALKPGKFYAVRLSTEQFVSFGSAAELSGKIDDILSGKVEWASSEL